MANILKTDKQIAVVAALAEGNSIRSIERMTGIHRDTIMRLGVRVGQGCERLLSGMMVNLPSERLQLDELWGFVGSKQKRTTPERAAEGHGDVWTFCAVDADTKIVPCYRVGKRDAVNAVAFVQDLAGRLRNRVQISTDALSAYIQAVDAGFATDVDYGQIVKTYSAAEPLPGNARYSPAPLVKVEKLPIIGNPDPAAISTSYVEKLNHTTRMHMRRLTRLTNAFSKKLENFKAAVGLHFGYYNLVKRHITLRMTPAMAAGVVPNLWTVADLVNAAGAA